VAALGIARHSDLRPLVALRVLLTDESMLRIARKLHASPGVTDEVGQMRPWVTWASDCGQHFAQLWALYSVVRSTISEGVAVGAGGGATAGEVPELPRAAEHAFAVAFAESLGKDPQAPAQWESRHASGLQSPALDESLRLISRMLRHNPGALRHFTAAGALRVLRAAIALVPSSAVRVSGPEALAGIYRVQGKDGASLGPFIRDVQGPGSPCLVLRRVLRTGPTAASIHINWDGIPKEMLRSTKSEWRLQKAEDDEEADVPMALSLEETADPADIQGTWWLCTGKRQTFRRDRPGNLQVAREAVAKADLAPVVAALTSWVRHGGVLPEFAKLGRAACPDPVLIQLCCAAAVELQGAAGDTSTEDKPRPPQNESMATGQAPTHRETCSSGPMRVDAQGLSATPQVVLPEVPMSQASELESQLDEMLAAGVAVVRGMAAPADTTPEDLSLTRNTAQVDPQVAAEEPAAKSRRLHTEPGSQQQAQPPPGSQQSRRRDAAAAAERRQRVARWEEAVAAANRAKEVREAARSAWQAACDAAQAAEEDVETARKAMEEFKEVPIAYPPL